MVDIDIVDTAFAHAPGMSWYNVPRDVRWVRGRTGRVPIRFFTDRNIGQVDNYPADVNVALLMEPRCFDENGYVACLKKLPQLNYCLTYDRDFMQEVGDKALFYPIGGCWLKPDEMRIHPKTELVSIIASNKTQTRGHQLRHEVIKRFGRQLEVYGYGYNPVEFKAEALAPFHYSIVIENGQVNDLFTEKLIDCFLTGTIPIYWGTPNIGHYFNMNGVITFESADELERLLHGISPVVYSLVQDAVKENFAKAQSFRVAEDWIFSQYPFLLP